MSSIGYHATQQARHERRTMIARARRTAAAAAAPLGRLEMAILSTIAAAMTFAFCLTL